MLGYWTSFFSFRSQHNTINRSYKPVIAIGSGTVFSYVFLASQFPCWSVPKVEDIQYYHVNKLKVCPHITLSQQSPCNPMHPHELTDLSVPSHKLPLGRNHQDIFPVPIYLTTSKTICQYLYKQMFALILYFLPSTTCNKWIEML